MGCFLTVTHTSSPILATPHKICGIATQIVICKSTLYLVLLNRIVWQNPGLMGTLSSSQSLPTCASSADLTGTSESKYPPPKTQFPSNQKTRECRHFFQPPWPLPPPPARAHRVEAQLEESLRLEREGGPASTAEASVGLQSAPSKDRLRRISIGVRVVFLCRVSFSAPHSHVSHSNASKICGGLNHPRRRLGW